MKSSLHPVRRALLTLSCIAGALSLSACVTTPPVTLHATECFTPMVKASGLDKPTPHAAFPSEPEVGQWVDFANREAGQLDKANAEKAGVIGIGLKCEEWAQAAKKRAERKKFLGVF